MKFWLGCALLLLLPVLGVLSAREAESHHEETARLLLEAAQADAPAAAELLRQAGARWEDHRLRTAITADHTAIEQVDALFAQLEAANDEPGQLQALCRELAVRIRAMGDAQRLTLQNIL